MLTPDDHNRLAQLAAQQVVTPQDAQYIRKCMPSNSWLTSHSILWWYPIGNDGSAVPEGVRREHPISKPATIRPANPHSIEQQQPWIREGVSRGTWYQRKAARSVHSGILAKAPDWLTEAESLKLYSHLALLAQRHKLDLNELWEKVCKAIG